MRAAQMAKADPVAAVSAFRTSQSDANYVPDPRQLANLISRLALAGHAVHKGRERDYIVSKWGMSRWCGDFAALQGFATLLGVKHG